VTMDGACVLPPSMGSDAPYPQISAPGYSRAAPTAHVSPSAALISPATAAEALLVGSARSLLPAHSDARMMVDQTPIAVPVCATQTRQRMHLRPRSGPDQLAKRVLFSAKMEALQMLRAHAASV